MFNIIKKEIDWNGKKRSIETGKIARQADGAVILKSGDTVILAKRWSNCHTNATQQRH